MDIRLEYFWYDAPSSPRERLEAVTGELWVCALRLGSVVQRLRELVQGGDLTADNAEWKINDFTYHAETYLTAAYGLRERLIGALALLSDVDKGTLTGRGGYVERRRAVAELRRKSPAVAREFNTIENKLRSTIELRGVMTHEAFLHLAMFMGDSGPWEPADALNDVRRQDESAYLSLCLGLTRALEDFVANREREAHEIEQSASLLVDALKHVD